SVGVVDATTSIGHQLRLLADYPRDRLRTDLEEVWDGQPLPAMLQELISDPGGARRIADELGRYWTVAIEPYWKQIRAVLDDDVAYRATRLTSGGIAALLSDLHPEISVHGHALRIDKRRHTAEKDLSGNGLLLVPSVFAWPNLVVDYGSPQPSLVYGCRG